MAAPTAAVAAAAAVTAAATAATAGPNDANGYWHYIVIYRRQYSTRYPVNVVCDAEQICRDNKIS